MSGRHLRLSSIIILLAAAGWGAASAVLAAPAVLSATSSRPVFSERVPILMYHYISVPPATTTLPGLYLAPSVFASELQSLHDNKYHTVFVSEVAASLRSGRRLPARSLALSFDDGYEDFYVNAFPCSRNIRSRALSISSSMPWASRAI